MEKKIIIVLIVINFVWLFISMSYFSNIKFTDERVDYICEYMMAPINVEFGGDSDKVIEFHSKMYGNNTKKDKLLHDIIFWIPEIILAICAYFILKERN